MLFPEYLDSVLVGLFPSVQVTNTIALDQAIGLESSDVTGAITAFFAIGGVLAVLALVLALRFAPLLAWTLEGLVNGMRYGDAYADYWSEMTWGERVRWSAEGAYTVWINR